VRKKFRRATIAYWLIALCFLFWVGRSIMSAHMLENVAAYIMYPILIAQNKIVMPVKAYFEKKRSIQEFEDLVKKLQAERDELIADNIQMQAHISYVSQTADLAQFKQQYKMDDAILAQVLVKHFSDQSHYFLIDKGLNAGICQDMVAIHKNCLLGKVIEVYPHYSKVLLITDKLCKVAAHCPHTRASGIHQGSNEECATGLHFVSHLSDIEPEDLVLSSGDGLIFPKGFALGRIKSCASQGLFYDVSVEPLLDMRKIDFCFIIQKGGRHLHTDHDLIAQAENHVTTTLQKAHDIEVHTEVAIQQQKEQIVSERIAMLQVEQSRTYTQLDEVQTPKID